MLLVRRGYLAVAMQGSSVCLFLSSPDETMYHSRWVVQCISRLPLSAFESCAWTVHKDGGACIEMTMVDAIGVWCNTCWSLLWSSGGRYIYIHALQSYFGN